MSSVPALSLQDVSITFGGLKAVSCFTHDLPTGALEGLIGPNGAGKTTLFNLLTGVYKPTSGSIKLDGREIHHLRPYQIAQRGLSRTFQNIRLCNQLSVLDNVQIAQHQHKSSSLLCTLLRTPGFCKSEALLRQEALQLLKLFDLESRARELACNLSYGDKRRLEIVRALATRPRVLLLDEPAAGMNTTEKAELARMIRRLRDEFELTILLIEHDMSLVMDICERITVVEYGKIIAKGTPEEIQNNPLVIEAYLGISETEDEAEIERRHPTKEFCR
ncbi:MAG: ABC transporter ATP-binding protein [Candidatus Sumerlaeia bacterium]|nr:ABC transporter ATP-binding protein [Candidatus Sumerlaeia bacterium]